MADWTGNGRYLVEAVAVHSGQVPCLIEQQAIRDGLAEAFAEATKCGEQRGEDS
jgi:hypothetical protein